MSFGPGVKNARWRELMIQSQQGNQDSYATLLNELSPVLNSYFLKKTNRSTNCDDLVQETLLAIHSARHTFHPQSSLSSWVFGIAHHKMVDYFRHYNRNQSKQKAYFLEMPQHHIDPSPTSLEAVENERLLEELLEELTPRERSVLIATKQQNQSVAEAAKQLELSENNIKVIVHRSLKKLQKIFKARQEEIPHDNP